MHNIRRNLDLKRMSSLRKKELVEALAANIPGTVNEQVTFLTEEQFSFVDRFLQNNGVIKKDETNIDLEDLFFYTSIGYIHPMTKDEKMLIVMPQEVMDQFEALKHTDLKVGLRKNQRLINLLVVILHHYGVVEIGYAKRILEEDIEQEIELEWFLKFVEFQSNYYNEFHLNDRGYIVNELVENENYLIQKQESRKDLEYADIPRKDVLKVNKLDFFDRTPEVKVLEDYLKKDYGIDEIVIRELIEQFIYMVQLEDTLPEIVNMFSNHIEFQEVEEVEILVQKLSRIMNSTKLWILKGHTPKSIASPKEELRVLNKPASIYDFNTKQKVGRNDPCPCGSGKKFKKCCGK